MGVLVLSLFLVPVSAAGAQSTGLTFAAIGDYGTNDEYEAAVASMVNTWDPNLVVAVGRRPPQIPRCLHLVPA